jgi:aminoglycoside phosphotransferase (APT) family kinase protein
VTRELHAPPDPPPPAALDWAARAAGRRWTVVAVRRLTGGIATATHELTLERGTGGRRQKLVLRRPHAQWASSDGSAIAGEARTIEHVRAHAAPDVLPAPEVVGLVDGLHEAAPSRGALLTRKLPGRIDLAPADRGSWLQQQADALAAIHALPRLRLVAEPDLGFTHHHARRPPDWSRHPELWARALELVDAGPPDTTPTFTHGDFQHFNLLWTRGRLTGIVDWGAWPLRHPDSDTGHCRLNLVILYGSAVAEDFRLRYEAAAGRTVDPWWDLVETVAFLPSWGETILRQVRGRVPVRVADIHRRVDAHLPLLLDRFEREHPGS